MKLKTIGDVVCICMGVVMIAMGLYGMRIGEVGFGAGLLVAGIMVALITYVVMDEENSIGSNND